jgi:hypothetical protein
VGSYSGYSVFLGKPHRLLPDNYAFKSNILLSNLKKSQEEDSLYKRDADYLKIEKMFADNLSFRCLPEYFVAIDPYWGISELKTKEEMREIFKKIEKLSSNEKFLPYR